MHSFGVDSQHFINSSTSIREFTIQLTLGTISRIQKSSRLFNLTTESICLTFSNTNSLHDFLASTGLFFIALNSISELSLITLDGLLTFSICLVGMIKSKFKLSSQDLVFFLFKSSFSLFQSRLEFFLLYFQATTLLIQFMDGSTTISKLIQEILDFISQVLVFPFDYI